MTNQPHPTHKNTDNVSILYFPKQTNDWNLDTLDTTTTDAGRFVVNELCYTTTLDDRTYSIYIEHTGTGYTGILHDLTTLDTNPHESPIERLNTTDALTLDEMLAHLNNWLTNATDRLTTEN